jgi:hypothetical protein
MFEYPESDGWKRVKAPVGIQQLDYVHAAAGEKIVETKNFMAVSN